MPLNSEQTHITSLDEMKDTSSELITEKNEKSEEIAEAFEDFVANVEERKKASEEMARLQGNLEGDVVNIEDARFREADEFYGMVQSLESHDVKSVELHKDYESKKAEWKEAVKARDEAIDARNKMVKHIRNELPREKSESLIEAGMTHRREMAAITTESKGIEDPREVAQEKLNSLKANLASVRTLEDNDSLSSILKFFAKREGNRFDREGRILTREYKGNRKEYLQARQDLGEREEASLERYTKAVSETNDSYSTAKEKADKELEEFNEKAQKAIDAVSKIQQEKRKISREILNNTREMGTLDDAMDIANERIGKIVSRSDKAKEALVGLGEVMSKEPGKVAELREKADFLIERVSEEQEQTAEDFLAALTEADMVSDSMENEVAVEQQKLFKEAREKLKQQEKESRELVNNALSAGFQVSDTGELVLKEDGGLMEALDAASNSYAVIEASRDKVAHAREDLDSSLEDAIGAYEAEIARIETNYIAVSQQLEVAAAARSEFSNEMLDSLNQLKENLSELAGEVPEDTRSSFATAMFKAGRALGRLLGRNG